MLFPLPLVSVICMTGRRNAGGHDVVFHALAPREHMFLPVLRLAGEGYVQEISVSGL